MAQPQQQQQRPDPQAQQTSGASHQAARAALAMGMDAMSKSHDALTKTHGAASQILDQINQAQAQGGPPDQGQGGPQSSDQAIWAAFPSTDPNALQQLAQSAGGDMASVVEQWTQMSQQDQQDFDQRQMKNLVMLLQGMGSGDQGGPPPEPAGPPSAGPPLGTY